VRPSRSIVRRPSVQRSIRPSITMFPGPVSNAITRLNEPPAGNHVTFVMPPRFTTRRWRFGCRKHRWWISGVSGAPWPPAARSRGRKSATVSTPVRSAMTDGSPICSVERTRCRPSRLGYG